MKKILIIDNQVQRKDLVNQELQREGYMVNAIDAETLDFTQLNAVGYDLTIISLYPDTPTTWGIYLDFKQHFPSCPVLVYMSHHALESLKSAINNVFKQQSSPGPNPREGSDAFPKWERAKTAW